MVFGRLRTLQAAVIGLALICIAGGVNGAPGVRAQVDRSTVAVGESFTLSIIIEGVAAAGAPNLPGIAGINLGAVSQRDEFVFENNQATTKQVFDYQLIPSQPGDLAIPAISVQAGGRIFTTQPIAMRILAQGAAPAAQVSATNLALMRLMVPKKEAYVGESFPIEIHVYWQQGHQIRDVRMPQLKTAGFSAGQFGEPQQTSTVLNGVPFHVAIFRTAVTPARTGDLM